MSAAPTVAVNGVKLRTAPPPYLNGKPVKQTRAPISDLCSSGSITIKVHGDSIPKPHQLIAMYPSGVHKERMEPDDMYVLAAKGAFLSSPSQKPYPYNSPKCSDCAPLFFKAYGMSVKAKAANSQQPTDHSPRCIVLDIEGTTTPISFVMDVLFPYARDNVGKHLFATYDTAETQDDIKLLRSQIEEDLKQGIAGAVPVPSADAGKEEVVAALVTNVNAMIKADRKITALKQLQGHIWRTGFQNNELEGVVFEDVPEALEKWHALGIKVYIYSSGSRLAQRLIFGYTGHGDLRKYLSGFFDTTVGHKRETRSYVEISESVGVDKPSEILFITDVYQEATAAKAAGLDVVISVRPGNGPLLENHGFRTITSFSEI